MLSARSVFEKLKAALIGRNFDIPISVHNMSSVMY
jgi:hypothetical protein